MGPPVHLVFQVGWRSGDGVWVTLFCWIVDAFLLLTTLQGLLWLSLRLLQGFVIVMSRVEQEEMSLRHLILTRSLDFDIFKYIMYLRPEYTRMLIAALSVIAQRIFTE